MTYKMTHADEVDSILDNFTFFIYEMKYIWNVYLFYFQKFELGQNKIPTVMRRNR
jgi:hypothetical protein